MARNTIQKKSTTTEVRGFIIKDDDKLTTTEVRGFIIKDDDSPFWFAGGIVEGIAPEHCNCEGCVNFPCVGVCGLAERVERY